MLLHWVPKKDHKIAKDNKVPITEPFIDFDKSSLVEQYLKF